MSVYCQLFNEETGCIMFFCVGFPWIIPPHNNSNDDNNNGNGVFHVTQMQFRNVTYSQV